MPIFFVSDVHLDEQYPKITDAFIDFLATSATKADALYILGDLFEMWIGDDEHTPLQDLIQTKLLALTKHIPVYFIHGNRDFLLGKKFLRASGMTLLPDLAKIELYGKTALVLHGDTLCTDDIDYQAFRRKARNPWLQKLFLCLPLSLRKKIARKMRQASLQYTSNTEITIMDVTPSEVMHVMTKYQVELLIHGHTHRPMVHHEKIGTRIVLGAWHHAGSVLTYEKDHTFLLNTLELK